MKNTPRGLISLLLLLAFCSGAGAQTIAGFDDGFGPITPLSGNWLIEKGKLIENSDRADEQGRPFFATFDSPRDNNTQLSIAFEVYDGLGEILICPAWHDADNYIAAVWFNSDTVRLMQVREGVETILAEKKLKDTTPPLTLGVAVSGPGLRALVNGEVILESAAIFTRTTQCAVGGRSRLLGIDHIDVAAAEPWEADRSQLSPIKLDRPVGRQVFYRHETDARFAIAATNVSDMPITAADVQMTIIGAAEQTTTLGAIAPGETMTFACTVPTGSLRPDVYHVNVIASPPGQRPSEQRFEFTIVSRPHAQRFPVMMWASSPPQGAQFIADMGFTHVFTSGADYKYLWDNPDATQAVRNDEALAQSLELVEDAMRAGMIPGGTFGPGHFMDGHAPHLHRLGRDGQTRKDKYVTIDPYLPEAQQFSARAAEAFMTSFGSHPAFQFALLNSELRDQSHPSHHEPTLAAMREATGLDDVPDAVANKYGIAHTSIADFPANRIVPDDHELLRFYRWFWRDGDGWNMINRQAHDIMHARADERFFTWFDPAVRVAPLYGSGAGLDMIGNWTYTDPDPVRVGMTSDELLNMARGKQRVFQMIQSIWYRSMTAPKNRQQQAFAAHRADPWDDHDPDADYITPAPAQLTEAFWMAISRPVDMIGYHGQASLIPTGTGSAYKLTHTDAAPALARVHREILQPFGPMLLQIKDRPADVAFLESFASYVFAQRATYGWGGGTIGAMWRATQYAGLQSNIIYDETIMAGALDDYKVLVMPDCDVLTEQVLERIKAFQARGGIIIADERLTPAIEPDLRFDAITGAEYDTKPRCLEVAAALREQLAGRYEWPVQSSNLQVMLQTRRRGDVDYLFAINDERAAGDYVGGYGVVKENGLPARTTVTLARADAVVIDVIAGKRLSTTMRDGRTSFDLALEPGGGRLLMIASSAPGAMRLAAPDSAARGSVARFDITWPDADGIVAPFEIEIVDPAFRPADASGYYAAVDGKATVELDLADNERTGVWRVTVRDRLHDEKQTAYFIVE